MLDERDGPLEQELRQQETDRLFLSTRLLLKQERWTEAQAVLDRLREREPDSSELWEFQGDVLRRQGKRKEAQEAYKRAFDLDNGNADAERKFAEVVLFLGDEERTRRLQREAIEDPAKHHGQPRSPVMGVIYSCVFPGFGQLYARQHEKGLVLVAVAAIILMLMVNALVIVPFQRIGAQAEARGALPLDEQLSLWGQQVAALPGWQWLLVVLGILAFVALQLYSIVDAYRVTHQEAKEAEKLGV